MLKISNREQYVKLFKHNNKNTTMNVILQILVNWSAKHAFLCLYCELKTNFKYYPSVLSVDFEQTFAS